MDSKSSTHAGLRRAAAEFSAGPKADGEWGKVFDGAGIRFASEANVLAAGSIGAHRLRPAAAEVPSETPDPVAKKPAGTSVGGQAAAGWLSAGVSAGAAVGGLKLLALSGALAWAAVPAFAVAAVSASAALAFWLLSARLGIAMSDHLDSQIDPRDRDGELKRLIPKGWLGKLFFSKAVGAAFVSADSDMLPGHATRLLRLHTEGKPSFLGGLGRYARQVWRNFGYLGHEARTAWKNARKIGGMLREMAAGEKEVAGLLAPYRKAINLSRGLLVAKAFMNTAVAFSIGAMTDSAIAGGMLPTGLWLGALGLLVLAKAVVRKIYMWNSGVLRIQLRRDFRIHLFSHLLRLPTSFTASEDAGRLAVRLTQDVTSLTVKNVTIPIQFPHLVIQLALASGFVIYSSWQLSLIILSSIPLLAFLTWLYGRRAKRYSEALMTRQAILTTTGGDILSDLREIRSVSGEEHMTRRYGRKAERLETVMLKQIRLASTFQSVREFLQTFFTEILVLGLGLFSYLATGAPSIGQVMSLRGYAKDARSSVDGVLDLYADSKSSEGATKRVLGYLKQNVERDVPGAEELAVAAGEIEMRGVGYSLPGQGRILDKVDLKIRGGETVLFMGGTNRMRQSILDMLLRLDRPAEGEVRVDGQDIGRATFESLQGAMALVQRDPLILPDESLRGNLLFGNEREVEDEEIFEVVGAMGAGFLLDERRFPRGLDTPIDEGRFSDAERQRLALVRAGLRRPSILLIDGVGVGVAPNERKELLAAVAKLAKGRTALLFDVPSDRVEDVNRVVLLKSGKVEDAGPPEDVYRRSEVFRKVWAGVRPPKT